MRCVMVVDCATCCKAVADFPSYLRTLRAYTLKAARMWLMCVVINFEDLV